MSPLFALGVDVSTKATAMVLLDHTGVHAHRLIKHDTREQGARRLMQIRQAVRGALDLAAWDVHVAAVENPANRFANMPLEQAGAVVLEAVQATYRGRSCWTPPLVVAGAHDRLRGRSESPLARARRRERVRHRRRQPQRQLLPR